MRKDVTDEVKMRLIPIYEKVLRDFEEFPYIRTTEDFFIWRDKLKEEIEKRVKDSSKHQDQDYKKKLRNRIIEYKIKDNDSLKFLYDWSKCDRMVTSAKASVRTINAQYGIDNNNHIIKASNILHKYLTENGKINVDDLFNLFQIPELSLLVKYQNWHLKPITTPYEFENLIFKQEENPWPADLFVASLMAYGISADDLISIGRRVIASSEEYIEQVRNKEASKKYVYTNKGDN